MAGLMPWTKTDADRHRDARTYGSAEYKRNRAAALRRAGGKCEQLLGGRRCGSTKGCQVDHITPVSQGGTHHLDNLRVLCGTCHRRKTATEGGGYRRRGRTTAEDPPLQARTQW